MKKLFLYPSLLLASTMMACSSSGDDNNGNEKYDTSALTITSEVVVPSFLGNGPQWGGYDIVPQWTGNETLSTEDWNTIFKRLDFMRPQFIRMMISASWTYYDNGVYNPTKSAAILEPMLDYCQDNGVTVQFGEWGHTETNGSVDATWLDDCANFLAYLVEDKGYTCIKYFTMTNEPNGDWSTIDGSYTLWKSLVKDFYEKIEDLGIEEKVEIMGPDAAVWTSSDLSWVSNCVTELSEQIGAFDIHTYPDEDDVRTTSYSNLLDIYKASSDPDKLMVIGELGLKYNTAGELGIENGQRIQADPYASDDSQMFVYDAFYGIDVTDATIQTMNAGYAGIIYWMLDDAMYNYDGGSSKKLKRWGFWNILGSELCGDAADEEIRPWFYPISLMSRYFPTGTTIYGINMPDTAYAGLRCTAGEYNGKQTIVILNNGTATHNFTLKSTELTNITGASKYTYVSGDGAEFTGAVDSDGFPVAAETNVNLDLSKGVSVSIPAKSFIMYTNMN